MNRTHFPDCRLETRGHGDIDAVTCTQCRSVDWFRRGRPVVADIALAALFGDFDLAGRLDAVSAPGPEVLLYTATGGRRSVLRVLPEAIWLEVAPSLHASHDGRHLLLSPTDPVLVDNLTHGA